MSRVVFSKAVTPEDIQQVQHLNHLVFAEELGQHPETAERMLVDRFHATNQYFVAKRAGEVLGMISINAEPPFSIEKRLSDPGLSLHDFPAPCEVRLLSIKPGERGAMVMGGLFWKVYEQALIDGRSHMLISGIEARLRIYESLGFRALGPAVPEGAASFIPMALDLADPVLQAKLRQFSRWWGRRRVSPVSLLPGPVQVSPGVRDAFNLTQVSHRDEQVASTYSEVRARLSMLAGGMPAAVLTGSGTLANDAIAMCLKARFISEPGLVLSNGEFGSRLEEQARRAGLQHETLRQAWGTGWNRALILKKLTGGIRWVWGVHLETSTGQLNDLGWLSDACAARGVALAADCVSSLGAVPLEPLKLALASGVSGKSLGAYAGLAFVFVAPEMLRAISWGSLPSSFDLARNIAQPQPVFTIPSPQLFALHRALEEKFSCAGAAQQRYEKYATLGAWVRQELRECSLPPLVGEESAAPVICTFSFPGAALIQECRSAGFQLAYQSCYLERRGWAQLSIMGDIDAESLSPLFRCLAGWNRSLAPVGAAVPSSMIG